MLAKEYIAATPPGPENPSDKHVSSPTGGEEQTRAIGDDEITVDGYVMKPEVRGTSHDPRALKDEQWLVKVRMILTLTNPLTRSRFAWKVHTRFYYVHAAAHAIRSPRHCVDHSSIPDGNIPPSSFLAPYDDSTSPGSSSGYPESATSDQRCLQARAAARVGTSTNGGDDAANVAYRYCAQGNHRGQVDLRGA